MLDAAQSLFGLPPIIIAALVLVALIAGFIDSIAGGGGLLTVPATLIAGLPQVDALATNKLQSSFGSGSATLAFARAGRIDFRAAIPWVICTFAGAAVGAMAVTLVPKEALRIGLPVLLVLVAFYFLFSPALRDEDGRQRLSAPLFGVLVGCGIGFYDGIFGPARGRSSCSASCC